MCIKLKLFRRCGIVLTGGRMRLIHFDMKLPLPLQPSWLLLVLVLLLLALLQIKVKSALAHHRKLRRVHSTHHNVIGNLPEMVKDGLDIIDHGSRCHATEYHLAQLHSIPYTAMVSFILSISRILETSLSWQARDSISRPPVRRSAWGR